jgi:hypothetical protein
MKVQRTIDRTNQLTIRVAVLLEHKLWKNVAVESFVVYILTT